MTAPLAPDVKRDPLAVLTQAAVLILLALVAVRATVNELQNDAFGFGGSADSIGGPGPTTTILLNFACVVPALLVLVRRAIDRAYVLRWHWSYGLAFALTAWLTLSCAWASNKFDALLYASNWWAAVAILWAVGQVVRSWTRLRPVLGVAAGLVLIFVAQALIYRVYELPELKHYWATDPDIAARRAADPDDFTLKQMDRAVNGAAMQGFFRSPNTYAAISLLTAMVTVGFVGQHLLARRKAPTAPADGTEAAPGRPLNYARPGMTQDDEFSVIAAVVLGLPLIGVPLILAWTGSRTAVGVATLAAVALPVAWLLRDTLARRSRTAYALGVAAVCLGVAAVVVIGLKTGGLLQDSLNFRWNYWAASAAMVARRPLLGVGWDNFGPAYLGVRLPVAAEEIKDPHNLFVRFATETGVVGLALALAWVARSLWEATRPVSPKAASSGVVTPWMKPAIGVVAMYLPLRIAVLWPLTLTLPELLKTLLFGLLLLVGLLLTVARRMKDAAADERPAPFLVYATIVGLLAFLVHNQVDFALSETGPLLLFMLVLGGLLGVRHPGAAGKKPHTVFALASLAGVFLLVLVAAGLWAVPVMLAEAKAAAAEAKGNEALALQASRPEQARQLVQEARDLYREAIAATPVANPDYPRRAVRWQDSADPKEAAALYAMAVAADPADPQNRLDRARFARQTHAPAEQAFADYDAFVRLNPNSAPGHVEYAQALDAAGEKSRADAQYAEALRVNDGLNPDEPRRLPKAQVEQIKQRLGK